MYHITAIRIDQPHARWETSFRLDTWQQVKDACRSFIDRGYVVTVHEHKHNSPQDSWEWVPIQKLSPTK